MLQLLKWGICALIVVAGAQDAIAPHPNDCLVIGNASYTTLAPYVSPCGHRESSRCSTRFGLRRDPRQGYKKQHLEDLVQQFKQAANAD